MNVFVGAATGVIGAEFAPQLAAAGHHVIGMTRSPAKTEMLRVLGAHPVVATRSIPTRSPCRDRHRHSGFRNGVVNNSARTTS